MEGTGLAASASASLLRATGAPSAERRARVQTRCWRDGKWRLARLLGTVVTGLSPGVHSRLSRPGVSEQREARWRHSGVGRTGSRGCRETAGGGERRGSRRIRDRSEGGQSCLLLSKVTTLELKSLGF